MQYIQYEDPNSIEGHKGDGFGLGVLVKTAKNIFRNGIGWYCWAGALSTHFDVDPKNEQNIITLTQKYPQTIDFIFH